MPRHAWGIDIGDGTLKAVRLKAEGRNLKVVRVVEIPYLDPFLEKKSPPASLDRRAVAALYQFGSSVKIPETDLVALGYKAAELPVRSGEETLELLVSFYTTIVESVDAAVKAIRDNDQRAAETVLMLKESVRAQSEALLARKAQRLTGDDREYLALVRIEMSAVDQLRRIYTLSKRIAKVVLPPALANQD